MEKPQIYTKDVPNGNTYGDATGENVQLARNIVQPGPPERNLKSLMKINPKLLPVKLLIFLIHGGVAALFPYFTLHMMSVGINIKEIAVILFLLPIVSSIGPPIGGFLADKIGNYKIVLIIFTILSVILHTLLWFAVPFYQNAFIHTNSTLTDSSFVVNFPCGNADITALQLDTASRNLYKCRVENTAWKPADLSNCKSNCVGRGYDNPRMCFSTADNVNSYCYNFDHIEFGQLTGVSPFGNTSWSPARFAIPTKNNVLVGDLVSARCVSNDINPVINCSVSCEIKSRNEVFCRESLWRKIGDRVTTLALYFTWRFLSFTAMRVVFPLSDAAVLEIAKQEKGDFGMQRLFASVGFCIVPPISGWLIGVAKRRTGTDDYSPAFYIFGALNLLAVPLMIWMKFGTRKPQVNIWKSMGVVLRIPNVAAFTIAIFFGGCAFGVLVNYLFLFMKNDPEFIMRSPHWLFGLTNTVGYLLGIPLIFFSTQLIRIFGHENIVAFGLICYAARFLLYSYTYHPFWILPTEIFTAVTGMVMVVFPQFAIKTAPRYLATLVGLFGAVNFGLGGGIGPLIAGFMIEPLGYRNTFRIWAGISLVAGILYFLAYHLVLKRLKTTILPTTDVPEVISRLPVITPEEMQPLAPACIETIVQHQPSRHILPRTDFTTREDPKDPFNTFRQLEEQQNRLLPEGDARYNLDNTAPGTVPYADWTSKRRSSNF